MYVEIGALRQVVPEALQHAWGFTVRGHRSEPRSSTWTLTAIDIDIDIEKGTHDGAFPPA